MTLADLKKKLVDYHGSANTVDFQEDWNGLPYLALNKEQDLTYTRKYDGDFLPYWKTAEGLDELLAAMKELALAETRSARYSLCVKVKVNFTKKAMKKPLDEVVNVRALSGRLVHMLTDEMRGKYYTPRVETTTTTKWVLKGAKGGNE